MGNWLLQLHLTLIFGRSGSGKTTFAFRYIFNRPAACRFVYDHQGRDGPRIASFMPGVRPCYTATELEAALATRCVIFNPRRMFPEDMTYAKGFAFFCQWVYDVSRRAPGKKFLLVNEINQLQDRDEIPRELSQIVLAGREENIELVCCAQEPNKVNAAIIGQASEIVCFSLNEPVYLAKVAQSGFDQGEIRSQPMGLFVSREPNTGATMRGRVF